ncbi:triacylglycerol lipase 2 isoform X2 [Pyrus x bretschneideri]|uniref:triacylglycerol lipase 2 isoform X2 n=1 Tax=Pyrus x bretschneideri TaxID=225117 RepID=UPI0020309E16|nr:triacylglycerol lipase 2 isoform X2 [Pyrus x bretschneideri]
MQRLRSSGSLLSCSQAITQLRKKAFRSWGAVQDTYFSTKDIFESHKVVFTVGTSIASVATAWFGYTLRHLHESRVDQRLESIEEVMKNNHNLEQSEIRNIMDSGTIGLPSCIATAGTTLVIGYALGWRGGRWYANRKFRREQMKLLGQIKPKRWPLLRRIEPKVTTQDGYILSMQRIPAGKSGGLSGKRVPVLLQHGLLMDGITWVLLRPGQSLAFLLADNGYEVWIGNTRGTKYSLGHTSLSPDDPAYWEWSWDELVAYDLPATFQYVRDQTRQKIHYIGHSLGTLVALAAISKDLQLKNLRSAVLLSPIAYADQMSSPLARAVAENFIAEALYNADLRQFNLKRKAAVEVLKAVCRKPGVDCTHWLTAFTGKNCCLNSSIVDVLLDHEPQSTSTKNLVHMSQMIRDGTVAMFDYKDENMQHYGQPNPPVYSMTSIPDELPLFLSYGGADALSDIKDVKLLLKSLKNHDGDKLVLQYLDDYAHLDFVMGETAKQDVYDPLMAFLRLQ